MPKRIFITGAAGLVGQNLIAHLRASGITDIIGVDKHSHNLAVLKRLHPDLRLIDADCAEAGEWEELVHDCDSLVILHAQIGGLHEQEFVRNNVSATERVLRAAERGRLSYIVHVSSSVVNSTVRDFYVGTKMRQEALVQACKIRHVILRPTLMFGWFDRKHLGWLKRFMHAAPLFPVPGNGRYLRQPLYAGDFCAIVASCLRREIVGDYNVSGLSRIHYIDLVRELRRVSALRTPIVRIPYSVFWLLLSTYALFDRNPPFTTAQLKALVTPEEFEVIDWPTLFDVTPTPLREALERTFNDPRYSHVTLQF
jgi:nucleoside-diphosphate-sugar epimerase